MSRTDLLADAFTMIRNAAKVKKEDILMPYSKLLITIAGILKDEGYIENFKEIETPSYKLIKVYLKYKAKKSVIMEIKRISRPGWRKYVDKHNIPAICKGHGIAIISTSQGVFTDKEARKIGLGGEVLGAIW